MFDGNNSSFLTAIRNGKTETATILDNITHLLIQATTNEVHGVLSNVQHMNHKAIHYNSPPLQIYMYNHGNKAKCDYIRLQTTILSNFD